MEKKEITEIKDIAEELSNFFTNVGPNVAKKSPTFFKLIHWFLKSNTQCNGKNLAINNRVKEGFLLIKN